MIQLSARVCGFIFSSIGKQKRVQCKYICSAGLGFPVQSASKRAIHTTLLPATYIFAGILFYALIGVSPG